MLCFRLQVLDYEERLLGSLKELKAVFGGESNIVCLAMAQVRAQGQWVWKATSPALDQQPST